MIKLVLGRQLYLLLPLIMTPKAELLFEGSYLYFLGDSNYSQENFKIAQLPDRPVFHVYSEILSRVETGDFLKLIVRYEMTNNFTPFFVRIEKYVGERHVQETFNVDLHNQELHYSFQTAGSTQEFKRPYSAKHYLTSPSFATAAMFSLSKKIEATGRTAVTMVRSNNEWTCETPPVDKIVYAEFKNRAIDDFKLNNTPLKASHLALYEYDTTQPLSETPVDLYLSKHFAIPYQLVQGDLRIEIKSLKQHA
jgi:hypothetical protein